MPRYYIRKTTQRTPAGGMIVNEKSESTQDTYSCDYLNNNAVGGSGGGGAAPIGAILPWPTDTPPESWLICDGSEINRDDYHLLFNVIGTTYGIGDGSTTFNLPDYRGRVLVQKDAQDTDFNSVVTSGGNKTHNHTATGDKLYALIGSPEGNASALGFTSTGWHGTTSTYSVGGNSSQAGGHPRRSHDTPVRGTTDTSSTLQPYSVVNYIIKADYEAEDNIDDLPIGTEVDIDVESTDDIPEGWEIVQDDYMVVTEGNGYIVRKYRNGIMEIDMSKLTYQQVANAWGNAFISCEVVPDNFPVEFTDVPFVTASVFSDSGDGAWLMNSTRPASKTSPPKYILVRGQAITTAHYYTIQIHAVGKWK